MWREDGMERKNGHPGDVPGKMNRPNRNTNVYTSTEAAHHARSRQNGPTLQKI